MNDLKKETTRIHCNKCGHKTKHLTLLTRTQSDSEPFDEYYVSWTTIYDVFECCGCESVTLRREFHFSEWERGDHELDFYPPRIGRPLPKWKGQLTDEMQVLLEEIYAALQADSRSLAMMGARALIDMVMLQKIGDIGTFTQKLSKLESDGFLSKKNRKILEIALDVGNAASHRGHRPKKEHVQSVMDIVEHLLQTTVLESITDELQNATPKRDAPKSKMP